MSKTGPTAKAMQAMVWILSRWSPCVAGFSVFPFKHLSLLLHVFLFPVGWLEPWLRKISTTIALMNWTFHCLESDRLSTPPKEFFCFLKPPPQLSFDQRHLGIPVKQLSLTAMLDLNFIENEPARIDLRFIGLPKASRCKNQAQIIRCSSIGAHWETADFFKGAFFSYTSTSQTN